MTAPVVEARNISVAFTHRDLPFTVLNDVSMTAGENETVGIVGESGCGKSTLAKALIGLVDLSAGEVLLDGVKVSHLDRRNRRPFRRQIQMIFQDPHASLNPRLTVGKSIETPLTVHGMGTGREREAEVKRLLDLVGLHRSHAGRYPHELSGGQRQRVGIARALAVKPRVLVADEAVSALDVSIQGQILNLLMTLKNEFSLALVFISHDLAAVQHVSDRVVVMYLGRIVEEGSRAKIWLRPQHPYTRLLLEAAPVADPDLARKQRPTTAPDGEVPSVFAPPTGCAFHPRCVFATAKCAVVAPSLRPLGDGVRVACHHAPIIETAPSRQHAEPAAHRHVGETMNER